MPTTTDERARTVCPACDGWGMLSDGEPCLDCDQVGWVWRPAAPVGPSPLLGLYRWWAAMEAMEGVRR